MLDVCDPMCNWYKGFIVCIFSLALGLILINPAHGLERPSVQILKSQDSASDALHTVSLIENETDIQILIHLIVQLRNQLVGQWCYFPPLTEVLKHCRDQLTTMGIEIEQPVFDRLYEEFERIDSDEGDYRLWQTKHKSKSNKKKKKDKEISINGKTAVGFLKFVGGSLICIIPIPIIQGAGVTLAVIGINDMMDGARENAEASDAEMRFDKNRVIDQGLNP